MTRLRAVLLALAMALGLAVGWGPLVAPASACSCGPVSGTASLAMADAAFVGRVADEESSPFVQGVGEGATTYTFDVLSVVKGDVVPDQQVLSSGSGASCGLELDQTSTFLVLGSSEAGDGSGPLAPGQLSAGLCGGTRALTAVEAAEFAAPDAPGEDRSTEDDDGVGSGPVIFLAVVTAGAALGFVAILRRHRRRTAAAAAAQQRSISRRRGPRPPAD